MFCTLIKHAFLTNQSARRVLSTLYIIKNYKISVHTINNSFLIKQWNFYKNFIPLRDKIEAGADLARTITSTCYTKKQEYLQKYWSIDLQTYC